ncbi:MAG: HAD family hydrolase [Clostridia bacterium]|nr:HAD family hydrolase [Clostridia bacterium]
MKKYTCLIFDADHTLLNYLADERAAFSALYDELGMQKTDELMAFSRRASEETWTEAGMYDVHDQKVQERYHAVYRSHVEEVFKKIFESFPCPIAISPKAAGEKLLKYLERESLLFPQVKETLQALSKRYKIAVATNGLSAVQRGRLRGLEQYADGVFISEEMGVIKPLPAFFDKICADLGVKKEACLMIGDSLLSDIAGAIFAEMDSCWYNPAGEPNTTAYKPTYEIQRLSELFGL